jgi:uncharacterized membrane protein
MAQRSGDLWALAVVNRKVVLADWLFTTPAVIIRPVTGIWMAHLAGLPLETPWLAASLGLYLLVGACLLPVVWLQLRMHALVRDAPATASPRIGVSAASNGSGSRSAGRRSSASLASSI